MKKVLLTGPNGFIGRHSIVFLLSKGFEIHAIDLNIPEIQQDGVYWYKADLLDLNKVSLLIAKIKPTHLLHFAWYAIPKEYWTSPENIRWVQASLEILRSFIQNGGQRIVMAGSCAEYDWNYGYCSEIFTPLKPSTLYGVAKHSLQLLLSMYSQQAGLSSAWGRIFFLYGPFEPPSRLISYVIRSLLNGEVAFCSQGTQMRDFLFVEDVASAFVSLLDSTVCGALNICSGQPIAVKEIVMKIAHELKSDNLIQFEATSNPADPPFLIGSNHRLLKNLDWHPTIDLSKGINKTIMWWQKQLLIRNIY